MATIAPSFLIGSSSYLQVTRTSITRVGKKYRYAGIPRYFFGVVRTAAHLPVPRYSGVSIFSNRNP